MSQGDVLALKVEERVWSVLGTWSKIFCNNFMGKVEEGNEKQETINNQPKFQLILIVIILWSEQSFSSLHAVFIAC